MRTVCVRRCEVIDKTACVIILTFGWLLSSSYDRLIPPPTIMLSVEHHRNLVKEDACHYLSATDLPVCRSSCQFRSPVSRSKFNTGHSLSCFNELCFRCLHRMTKKLHSFVSQISFFVVRTDPFSAIRHIPQTLTILSSLHVAILVVRQPYIQYHERHSSTTLPCVCKIIKILSHSFRLKSVVFEKIDFENTTTNTVESTYK